MPSPAEEARELLAPIWQRIAGGALDPRDESAMQQAVDDLPLIPSVAQLDALIDDRQNELARREEGAIDGPWLDAHISIAWAILAASRLAPLTRLHAKATNAIARGLSRRWLLSGKTIDLIDQIAMLDEAIAQTPERYDRIALLSNLAHSLGDLYRMRGYEADLTRRVSTLKEAVDLTPVGPARPILLSNLALGLGDRYDSYGDPTDLDSQVRLLEEALALAPSSPRSASQLNNLAVALGKRYRLRSDATDLARRITLLNASTLIRLR